MTIHFWNFSLEFWVLLHFLLKIENNLVTLWSLFGRYSGKPIVYWEGTCGGYFVELFLHKKKWLLCFAYNTNKNSISNDLDLLRKSFNLFFANYEILLILGDFHVEFDRTCMNAFYVSSFKSLVKKNLFLSKIQKMLIISIWC